MFPFTFETIHALCGLHFVCTEFEAEKALENKECRGSIQTQVKEQKKLTFSNVKYYADDVDVVILAKMFYC